MLNTNRYF